MVIAKKIAKRIPMAEKHVEKVSDLFLPAQYSL